tara:strand:+ start:143 stop:580 length:438 start_codon:yes stop_codon:yes gene_type:complete
MASELKVDKFTGVTTAGSIDVTGEGNSTTTNLQQGLCKAWMSLNGSSTIALHDSFNTASTTDNGSGDYTQTYTNAMNNDDYSVVGSVRAQSSSYLNGLMVGNTNSGDKSAFISTSSVRITTNYAGGSSAREDRSIVNTQICGDLA